MPQPLKRWIDIKGVLFETANEIPRSETYALDMLAYISREIRGCILLSEITCLPVDLYTNAWSFAVVGHTLSSY